MHETAYGQYAAEAETALKRERARLVSALIEIHGRRPGRLELLEIGAGVGQNVGALARFGNVDVEEINPQALERLRAMPEVRRVYDQPVPFALAARYDVVCALDVIEHLADDRQALRWIASLLAPGGVCVLTVPAYPWLFSDHDRALGHHRRYTPSTLRRSLPTELTVVACGYFNSLLFPAAVGSRWAWQAMRRARGRGVESKQSAPKGRLSDAIVGAALRLEVAAARRGWHAPFGLSLYCVVRRTEERAESLTG